MQRCSFGSRATSQKTVCLCQVDLTVSSVSTLLVCEVAASRQTKGKKKKAVL